MDVRVHGWTRLVVRNHFTYKYQSIYLFYMICFGGLASVVYLLYINSDKDILAC